MAGHDENYFSTAVGPALPRSSIGQNIGFLGEPIMSTYAGDQAAPIRALLLARTLGLISVAGMALATIPPTSIVGAIMWTGYLGNVVVTHLNMI
jgi:hypothetical protein